MIYRIYPVRDTFLTNDWRPPSLSRLTASNLGFSEELDVFKRAGISGAIGLVGSSSLGRALLQFDLTQFNALTASGDIPRVGLTFTLRMAHKTHGGTQPSSFDMIVSPISSSWDEGRGVDVCSLRDNGFANWERRTSTQFWTAAGGDYLASPTASYHFDTGLEDLDVDVTSIVNGWLSGTYANNGLAVAMHPTIESDLNFTNFFEKKFYSRHTQFTDRAPYLEVRANTFVHDDRLNFQWGRTGTLYLYNVVGGLFQDLPGNFVTVGISDLSGVLTYLTASRASVGVYSASFALPTGAFSTGRPYSGSVFYDSWGSGSFAFSTGTFVPSGGVPVNSLERTNVVASIRNLQDEYFEEDVATLQVFFRRKPHTLPVVNTASLQGSPYIVERCWYAVENDATRVRVIPFGTGTQDHTRLSYDGNGNSFRLFMSSLHAGNVYRILFLTEEAGKRTVIDQGLKFKVI